MNIAFPVSENKGLESIVYGHFGSAPAFIIVEKETGVYECVINSDMEHSHGQCQPLKALGGQSVDVVVVGGIGAGALMKLQSAGISVYRAVEGTVADNLTVIKTGHLPRFEPGHTCKGHHGQGQCIHDARGIL